MKKSKIILIILAVSLIGLLGGCSTETKRYAIITSKSLNRDNKCNYYFYYGDNYYFVGDINEFEVGDTVWLKK